MQGLGALWLQCLGLFFGIIQKLWPSLHNINNVCNVELSLSSIKKKKKKKKRTKYGKNVLVAPSLHDVICIVALPYWSIQNEDPKDLFPRENWPVLYPQIGNRNFFICIADG